MDRYKPNLVSIVYFDPCGDSWVTEDAEIGFHPLGDTGRHDAPCSQMLQAAMKKGFATIV
jgi:hypothetical protein